MQRGDHLEDDHHVLRYVKPTHVDGAHISTSAFLCRESEDAASVNWMERFEAPVANQCACIKAEKRIAYRPTGRLARLSVGVARTYVLEEAREALRFVYDPEDPAPPKFPLPHTSHSLVHGMPKLNSPEGEMVGALLRDCIPDGDVYPITP